MTKDRRLALQLIATALVCTGLSIYFHIFSGFSSWDDEGCLMATVDAFLRGHLLYDQVYTLYGPFYYLFEWLFYSVTQLPVSHDCVRLIAMVLWPTSVILIAWAAHRITGSLVLSGFTLLAVARLLVFFQFEPGHPEEVCIVLVACLFVLASRNAGRITGATAIGFGFLLSALAMTKINIGLYATLALLLSFLAPSEGSLAKKATFVAVGISSFACIVVIMSPLFDFEWARNYCCFVLLSLLSALVVTWEAKSDVSMDMRTWYIFGASFTVTALLIVIPFLLRGTTISALLYVTVIQHKDFARHWFKASPFTNREIVWCSSAVGLALVHLRRALLPSANRTFLLALQILKGALGLFGVYNLLASPVHPRMGLHTVLVLAPFSWLVMVRPRPDDRSGRSFARTVICFLSVLLVMYAFPVWGSQWMFAAVPLVLITAAFLNDARIAVCAWKPQLASHRIKRFATTAALLVLAIYYSRELRQAQSTYSGFVPFALPGANYIRVSRTAADTNQWLTRELKLRCSSFFSMPGLFSLYFWAHQNPPTMLVMNDWPAFFNAQQQDSIISDLKQHSTACIVYNPDLVEFLRAGQDLSLSPLARYIHAEFVPIEQRNGYYFMVRRDKTN